MKIQNTLRKPSYKIQMFIRPYPDYGDIIYDQAYNASFQQNSRKHSVQCRPSNCRRYTWNI